MKYKRLAIKVDETWKKNCFKLHELETKYSDQLPKVGDILIGEVTSEREYGYFIKIMGQSHNHHCSLDGLLHKSNLCKNSQWSLASKQLRQFDVIGRQLLVKIIDKNSKGFSLEEMDYSQLTTIEEVLNGWTYSVSLSKSISETINYDYQGLKSSYKKQIILETEQLQYTPVTLSALIFKNDLYLGLYANDRLNHLFTKNLDKHIIYKKEYGTDIVIYDEDYFNNEHMYNIENDQDKIWKSSSSIEIQNEGAERRCKEKLEGIIKSKIVEEEENRIEHLLSSFEESKPLKELTMYKAFYIERCSRERDGFKFGRIEYDKTRYIDFEEVFEVKIHLDSKTQKRYVKINNKYYIEGDSKQEHYRMIILNDEVVFLQKYFGRYYYDYMMEIYISTKLTSNELLNKYADSNIASELPFYDKLMTLQHR